MSATPLTARIAAEHADASRALPPRLPGSVRRRAAMAALESGGLPVARDENWRYANLRPLERLKFAPAAVAHLAESPAAGVQPADLPAAVPGYSRYVFVDGVFAPALSAALRSTSAVITPLASLADEAGAPIPTPRRGSPHERSVDERFALLNEAFATDGAAISVSAGGTDPARLELVFVARADALSGASYPRVELHLEPRSKLALIERHVSSAEHASFVNSAVSVELGRGATLQHYRLQ
ncbi:MAG: hypothetical protein ACRETG_10740, partial [Steroidobacteraceae bacterium]